MSADRPAYPDQAMTRKLELEYAFDHRLANCDGCSLRDQRERTECLSQKPEHFNGIMLVGEGPGEEEARFGVPFIGRSGKLLNAILTQAGIDRGECYVANSTACLPPPGHKKKGLVQDHPTAILGCRPRLFTEIAYVQPRMIVCLGGAAFAALSGTETEHNKRVPYNCETCNNARSWRRYHCTKCKTVYDEHSAGTKEAPIDPPEGTTPCCDKKWQPKIVKCAECGGYKTIVQTTTTFAAEYKISEAAGGVFRASDLPLGVYLEDPDNTLVLPTYHPAHCLHKAPKRSQNKQAGGQFYASILLSHLEKAKRLVTEDPSFPFEWREAVDAQAIRDYADNAVSARLSVDIETDSKDKDAVTRIKSVGLWDYDGAALTVDTDYLPEDHPKVQALAAVCASERIAKVLQNGWDYDLPVLDRMWGVVVRNYAGDTKAAHNSVHPDEPHDLAHIGFTYTDAKPWKQPKKSKEGGLHFDTKEELHAYNAYDCVVTGRAEQRLLAEIEREGAQAVYDIDMKKARMAVEMRRYGMPVDRKKQLEVIAEAQYKEEKALHAMRQYIGGKVPEAIRADGDTSGGLFNPNSPYHLRWALYDNGGPCKLTATRFTDPTDKYPNGVPSTDKVALQELADHPFVRDMLDFRKAKQIHNQVEGMPIGDDMRLHCDWRPVGPVTGRWASSPNFQNLPKWIRSLVHVNFEERAIVGADKSQLELRISAALSGDEEMIRRCRDADEGRKLEPDHDPHSYIASVAFGESYTGLLLKDPGHDPDNERCNCQTCIRKSLRDIAKRVIYGVGYGAGGKTVRDAIYDGGYEGPPISLDTIENVIKAIWRAFPDFGRYMDEVVIEAEKTGKVWDPLIGRRREFPLFDVDATVARNYPIQCLPAGTRVLTRNGYVPVETVPDGGTEAFDGMRWESAIRLDKSEEPVWEVTLDNGMRLRTNEGHYLSVLANDASDFSWEKVADLQEGNQVALPLAERRECGAAYSIDDAYWLGYWFGNGSWYNRAHGEVVSQVFGTRKHRASHGEYAQSYLAWLDSHGFSAWKPQVCGEMTTVASTDPGLSTWLEDAGVTFGWHAKTKRVPERVWRMDLRAREAFLLGFFEADGTLALSMPQFNSPNRLLLEDVQKLARTCGFESRLRGPYKVDRKGHMAWVLAFAGSLLRRPGFEYGATQNRQRFSPAPVARAAVDHFLERVPRCPFSDKRADERSFRVLYGRIRNGGSTNPHTLKRMWEAVGEEPSVPLYTSSGVRSVKRLDETASMHTLSVRAPSHRYDSEGFVSKNSGAASDMDIGMWNLYVRLNTDLKQLDPTCGMFAQVHDAVYVECAKEAAPQIGKALEHCLSSEVQFREGAPWMPLPAAAEIADNWKDAG